MSIDKSKWILLTSVTAAAFAFAAPAKAETPQVPGIVIAADDSMPAEATGEGEMKPDAAAPDTAADDSPAHTTSNPEGRMDDGEMEEGTVAPDTSADDGMMQKSDPDAVEEEDSSMDNEEVGDPSTD
ncbi:hypothetical protein A7A08_02962 [Methyloligella halotolerans]|uniref:Uncharacterized protein n=1 Tax=Methyloligella halotolerans TaxID=1177755 RepID=A0A1E2RVN3_9HYPH|nr:hypothetical protein [Methyloligella halotolerans]ODA66109.1 hypothetical protein A7A08_02962 [Methyloligella halotolerans]